ncbi:polysaccharide pyruvyl transferase family protein [Wenyingzhuangia sp. IMCC45574]
MEIKSYFWNSRKSSLLKYYFSNKKKTYFRYGNVGDIFNIDLINFLYQKEISNSKSQNSKALFVGSIASTIKKNDLICGIGWKGNDLSEISENISSSTVYGVRGPKTLELFKRFGANIKNNCFQMDPGILLPEVCGINLNNNTSENTVFIPHYNDYKIYKNNFPKEFKILNIDTKPKNIALDIAKSSVVYSSSLHGIIFAHAMGKECVFVKPLSNEPLFKYDDYFLSQGIHTPHAINSIHNFNFRKDKTTFLEKKITLNDFSFPSIEDLIKNNSVIL